MIVGIICWADESPAWLASSVASFCRLGLEHVVAVDGAYELFPQGTPRSGAEQHEALSEIVRPFGVGLTIHTPQKLWASEMQKRSTAFAIAEQVTTEDDWYVVFDADEMAEAFDLRRALEQTDKLVADCESWERIKPEEVAVNGGVTVRSKRIRRFYRALRGLRVVGNHTSYRAGPVHLRGFGEDDLSPSETIPMRVEHRWNFQDPQRRLRQETYYRLRDTSLLEQRQCCKCERQAMMAAPIDFRPDPNKPGYTECTWIEVCEDHLEDVLSGNLMRLQELGIQPERALHELGFDLKRARFLASTSRVTGLTP